MFCRKVRTSGEEEGGRVGEGRSASPSLSRLIPALSCSGRTWVEHAGFHLNYTRSHPYMLPVCVVSCLYSWPADLKHIIPTPPLRKSRAPGRVSHICSTPAGAVVWSEEPPRLPWTKANMCSLNDDSTLFFVPLIARVPAASAPAFLG